MPDILRTLGIAAADGILLDLGVSSHQFDAAYRGFSYNADAPLDMRMSGEGRTAADIVNEADYAQLVRILREYGEEKFAARIASTIVARREKSPITTTFELADAVRASVPAAAAQGRQSREADLPGAEDSGERRARLARAHARRGAADAENRRQARGDNLPLA
jgi:16S rRNA (cytosine(1402)-N(4))-methyltransferase